MLFRGGSTDGDITIKRTRPGQTCRSRPITSRQEQEIIPPVNSDYAKEDAIHPETLALEFHLDYQSVFASRVLRPRQIRIYETHYEGADGDGEDQKAVRTG